MAMPRVLKNFNLFDDGQSFQGLVDEIILPKLTRKLEEFRGAGMDGPVDLDLGQEKLELEWTIKGFDLRPMAKYGYVGVAGVPLRFNGAYQEDENCSVQAVQISVRGRHVEIDNGTAKGGEANANTKIKSSLTYYRLTVNNIDVIEIDLLNFIFIVDGVDRLAEMRAAIGL